MWFCFSLQSSQLSSHIIIHLCMQEDQKVREEFIYWFIFIFMYILQAELVLDFDNSWRLIWAQVKLNFLYIFSRSSNVIPAN